jgi:hypothetical protein
MGVQVEKYCIVGGMVEFVSRAFVKGRFVVGWKEEPGDGPPATIKSPEFNHRIIVLS